MNDLEKRIRAIEERNRRVESDKAWETSWTRRLSIAVLTYGVVVAYLFFINADKPFVSALVPAIGFMLSTLLLKTIRDIWQNDK
jgi:hypothetical protein